MGKIKPENTIFSLLFMCLGIDKKIDELYLNNMLTIGTIRFGY